MRISLLPMLCTTSLLLISCASEPRSSMDWKIRAAFNAADTDHDEQLTPAEFAGLPLQGAKFEDLDTDSNGRISLAELQSYLIWRRVQAEGNRPIDSTFYRRR